MVSKQEKQKLSDWLKQQGENGILVAQIMSGYELLIGDQDAEIERLRSALKPFTTLHIKPATVPEIERAIEVYDGSNLGKENSSND